jgi:hypothetical protein
VLLLTNHLNITNFLHNEIQCRLCKVELITPYNIPHKGNKINELCLLLTKGRQKINVNFVLSIGTGPEADPNNIYRNQIQEIQK